MRDFNKFTKKELIDAYIGCGYLAYDRHTLEKVPKIFLVYGILDNSPGSIEGFQDNLWAELNKK